MKHERIYLRENCENVYMDTYILDSVVEGSETYPKKPLVVICPGGAYKFVSKREAEPVALNFNAAGIHAVVVNYSLCENFPTALEDVSNAVVKVREMAEEWEVDTDRIIVCGFSAGGHLAASLGVFWNSEVKRDDKLNKPNGMLLCYPVITSKEKTHGESIYNISHGDEELIKKASLEDWVNEDCPPTFIWHTFTDELVPVENSIYMLSALAEKKIPTEAHIYPIGWHGLSLATEQVGSTLPYVQGWMNLAINWIKNL